MSYLLLLVLVLYSCTIYPSSDQDAEKENSSAVTSMNELQVPSDFTWKPSAAIELKVELLTVKGEPLSRRAVVSVSKYSGKEDSELITKGMSGENGMYRSRLILSKGFYIVKVSCGQISREKKVMIEDDIHVKIVM